LPASATDVSATKSASVAHTTEVVEGKVAEAIVDTEKSASKLGKGARGKGIILGVIVAAVVYHQTGSAYAAGQALNPLANSTDVATGTDPNGSYVLAGAKDLVNMTPLGLVYGGIQLGMAGGFAWLGEKAEAALRATSEQLGISKVERDWTGELTRMFSP